MTVSQLSPNNGFANEILKEIVLRLDKIMRDIFCIPSLLRPLLPLSLPRP
jgi:hypothetical protein